MKNETEEFNLSEKKDKLKKLGWVVPVANLKEECSHCEDGENLVEGDECFHCGNENGELKKE